MYIDVLWYLVGCFDFMCCSMKCYLYVKTMLWPQTRYHYCDGNRDIIAYLTTKTMWNVTLQNAPKFITIVVLYSNVQYAPYIGDRGILLTKDHLYGKRFHALLSSLYVHIVFNSSKDPPITPLIPRQFANNKNQTNIGQQKLTQFWLDESSLFMV